MNEQLNQVRAKLCAKSVINECDGAQYENGDIGLMNTHFDIIWEEAYGYHPKNLPDYWS